MEINWIPAHCLPIWTDVKLKLKKHAFLRSRINFENPVLLTWKLEVADHTENSISKL